MQPRRRWRDCRAELKPFTEVELKRAKDNILNSFLFKYDTKDKILDERERLEFYGYPADYLETYKAALEKVTLADVTAVAKKYIHPDKLAVLVVGNGPEIKPGLDELKLGRCRTVDITIPQPGRPAGRRRGKVSRHRWRIAVWLRRKAGNTGRTGECRA
jgi:zinc protease